MLFIKRITKFKQKYIHAVKFYEFSQDLRKALIEQNEELKKALKSPIEVVRALTDDKFKFFDYQELDKGEQLKYYDQAQRILKMEVFQNEVAKLNTEFITWAAKQSKDFDGVRDMRHQISGISLLEERLESIQNPNEIKKEVNQPYASL